MKKIATILLFSFVFSSGGNNPWIAFNVPSSASDLSLSRANISDGSIGFYQFSNPALLHKTDRINYGMSYNMMSLDRSTQVASININLPPKAGIGLSFMRSGTSNIQGRDIFNNDIGILNSYDMLGMISFGVSFSKYVSLGINIKASYSNLDNIFEYYDDPNYSTSNTGIGIDGGLLINYSKLSVGIKIENIASSKNWSLNLLDESNSYSEDIPIIYNIGTHFKILNELTAYIANSRNSEGLSIQRCAINYDINNFGFQGGVSIWESSYNSDIFRSPTLGFHYFGRIWKDKKFKLNYGIDLGSVNEGMSHMFSWTFVY